MMNDIAKNFDILVIWTI